MYNAHRGMMPTHSTTTPRLTELLEGIKSEFESQAGRIASDGHERDNFLQSTIRELEEMRLRLTELERTHDATKLHYEKQINDLKYELDRRPPPNQSGHGHSQPGPSQPAPPSIGHGPRDLFGQIMQGGQGGPALGPPPQQPEQPQGLPAHLTQGAGLTTGPPQHAFGQYQPQPGPALNGYQPGPPLPPALASPGPGRGRVPGRGGQLPGVTTPAPNGPQPYPPPGSPRSHMPTPPPGPHRQGPPPPTSQNNQQVQHAHPQQQQQQRFGNYSAIPEVGNELHLLHSGDLSAFENLPPDCRKTGTWPVDGTNAKPADEWWAVFNPKIPRTIDVDLMQTFTHSSVVCCVRFSADGRFLATGCNHIAQIFDVQSGNLTASLEDPNAEKDGDLYIRSVCFSPDGRYLATGAEDRLIRVWDIAEKRIKVALTGHTSDIYSLDFSSNGRIIASGSGDKSVRIWDVEAGHERYKLEIEDGVTTVALSHDGRLVAAGSLDRTVRVWDAESGSPLEWLDGPDGHIDSVYSVAFSPDGLSLVSGSLDKTIKMWSLPQQSPTASIPKEKGRCIRTFTGHADYVLSVSLTSDSRWVFSGSKDRGVQFWDPNTGTAQLHLCGHRNSVISVAPSPAVSHSAGVQLFATGSGDQKARVWRVSPYQG